jgi:hypothetical protein
VNRASQRTRRLSVAIFVAALGLLVTACGSTSGSASTTTTRVTTASTSTTAPAQTSPLTSGSITGFGATIAAWATTHTKVSEPVAGEPKASYWGPKTTSASVFSHQFVVLQTALNRVVALDINFPSGTALATAEKETYSELPADQKLTFSVVLMDDTNGNSCLLVNVKSAILGAVLAGPPFDDPSGTVGIEFATVLSAAALGYSAKNINGAFLQLRANTSQSSC